MNPQKIIFRILFAFFLMSYSFYPSKFYGAQVDDKQLFKDLREKWNEIPVGQERRTSFDLLKCSDEELLGFYNEGVEILAAYGLSYQSYKNVVKDKQVLDVGSGIGVTGIFLAQQGAQVTFLDIVKENLLVVKRICNLLSLKNVDFFYMEDLQSLKKLDSNFDFIFCIGSLINAPFSIIKDETLELAKHLKPKGRWIELCYPKERWEREGSMPFEDWGAKTDGGAPWMEWYDLEKMKDRFSPLTFRVISYYNFHDDDFNIFDLIIE